MCAVARAINNIFESFRAFDLMHGAWEVSRSMDLANVICKLSGVMTLAASRMPGRTQEFANKNSVESTPRGYERSFERSFGRSFEKGASFTGNFEGSIEGRFNSFEGFRGALSGLE